MLGVTWPQSNMVMENTMVADGSTDCYIATSLARDFTNGPLTDPVLASPSPLGEIEACFINKDEVMGCVQSQILSV